ncbi:sensor histidine kinase [Aliiglaciecola lipolytica]|uniref:histidine kinase n=1 Tax=Aliiglaciecola lipolytica E3 TaxID=1127673 RepID=K6YD65_9ALTE|nr:sensor histidine kinase [Aliiglaciecola lipolytica]GAC16142.1 two-component system, NarL family, sensor kinase [Aliiglaciecola lipolytica E3]
MSDDKLAKLLAQIQQQQAQLQNRLDTEQQSLSQLAKRLWAQQESEKARLSRELHDGVGQLLTGLTRRLQGLSKQYSELDELVELSELALADVRQLSRLMSPTILDDLGLVPALKWLSRSLFSHEDIEVELQLDNDVTANHEINILVYRIVQESFVNIVKHANATKVMLLLSSHHQTLRLDVVDNGDGFDNNCITQGIGLNSMQDRARAFDAELTIKSTPNKGTRITLTVCK